MPSTVYCQAINGEVLLCMEDGRTYSRREQMEKKNWKFLQTTYAKAVVSYNIPRRK